MNDGVLEITTEGTQQNKRIAMMDVFRSKTEIIFLTCDLLGGFSTGSFSFFLLFFEVHSLFVSPVSSVFTVSFGITLSELATPAFIIKRTIWTQKTHGVTRWKEYKSDDN